jgi:hypothetical protein
MPNEQCDEKLETNNEKNPSTSFVRQPGCYSSSNNLQWLDSIQYATKPTSAQIYLRNKG